MTEQEVRRIVLAELARLLVGHVGVPVSTGCEDSPGLETAVDLRELLANVRDLLVSLEGDQ